jgi:hypothetical protein
MAMSKLSREQKRMILEAYSVKTAEDINTALKDLFGGLLQEVLEAELDTELGYEKNGISPEGSINRRNGHTKKSVRSDRGEFELSVPRDREGEFEPIIVKKHQKEVTGIEEQILALYAKGVSVRDIQAHLDQLYGVNVSPALISNVTNRAGHSGLAVAAAAKGLCGGISGRHPLQGEAGRPYRQQSRLHGNRHRPGRLQGCFGYVHRRTRNLEILADGAQ